MITVNPTPGLTVILSLDPLVTVLFSSDLANATLLQLPANMAVTLTVTDIDSPAAILLIIQVTL